MTSFVVLASVSDGGPLVALLKALHDLGYFPIGIYESAKVVLLTAILFIGPLFEAGFAKGGWRDWVRLRGLSTTIRGWIGYRNYVAVGPSTHVVKDHPNNVDSTGPNNRRSSVPLRIRPTPPPGSDRQYHDHLPNPHHLWTGTCPPFLRVPYYSPSYSLLCCNLSHTAATRLHHTVRGLRYVPVYEDRKYIVRHPCA